MKNTDKQIILNNAFKNIALSSELYTLFKNYTKECFLLLDIKFSKNTEFKIRKGDSFAFEEDEKLINITIPEINKKIKLNDSNFEEVAGGLGVDWNKLVSDGLSALKECTSKICDTIGAIATDDGDHIQNPNKPPIKDE